MNFKKRVQKLEQTVKSEKRIIVVYPEDDLDSIVQKCVEAGWREENLQILVVKYDDPPGGADSEGMAHDEYPSAGEDAVRH